MATSNLLEKIRNQAKASVPTLPEDSAWGELKQVGTIPQDNKPSFSEITPYKQSSIYATLSSGERIPLYENVIPGTNNAERLAQQQGTGEKWLNGTLKFVGKTTTAVIGGTAGVVNGIGNLISEGSLVAASDNNFNKWLDDVNTRMDYKLPNYYTEDEKSKGLGGQMLTANFWADKVLGGLSFTIGTIASEALWAYATGGLGNAVKWSSKAIGVTRAMEGVANYSSLLRKAAATAYGTEELARNTAILLGKGKELANLARFAVTSAGYESSVETLQYRKEQQEQFFDNFEKLNGRAPDIEDIQKFNENLDSASNAVLAANFAIVGTSNVVQMGKIFGLKSPINLGIGEFIEKKAFGRGVQQVANGTFEVLNPSRTQNILRKAFYYGKAPVSEGLYEEGFQGVTSKAAGKWLQYSYDPQRAKETTDIVGTVYDSFAEQYGTKEGWVENGVGIIIGALGGSVGVPGLYSSTASKEMQAADAELQNKTDGLNTFTEKLLGEKFLTMNRINGFAQEAEQAEFNGELVKAAIANEHVFHSRINHAYKLGQNLKDLKLEARAALNSVTEQQFNDAGIATENIEEFKKASIEQYDSMVDNFTKNRKYAEYTVGSGKLQGLEDVLSAGNQQLVNNQEALIQAVTFNLTAGESAQNYRKQLTEKLNQELGNDRARVLNTVTQIQLQQKTTVEEINQSVAAKKALEQERENLTKKLTEIQAAPSETQGDITTGEQYSKVSGRLIEVNQKIAELEGNLVNIADNLNSQTNQSEELSQLNISSDDLTNLGENIKKFQDLIESHKGSDMQRYLYLTDLLDELNTAKDLEITNKATAQALMSGQLKLKNIDNWLSGMLSKGKSMDEFTRDWLIDVLQKYQENKVASLSRDADIISDEVYNDFVNNNTVPEEVLDSIAQRIMSGVRLTDRERAIYQQKASEIEDIIKETPHERPQQEQEEISKLQTQPATKTELEALKQQLDNALKNNMIASKTIDDKPTKKEIEEYRQDTDNVELRAKLGNWRLLNSVPAQGDMTIADLIEIINQLEQQVAEQETKDELTNEELSEIAKPIQSTDDSVVRYDLVVNANGHATAKKNSATKTIKLSHIKVESIANALSIPLDRITVQKLTEKGKLGKVQKAKQSDLTNYSFGTQFTLDNITLKIVRGNAIEISEDVFESNKDALNMFIQSPTINWSYLDVYERVGDTARKRPSDFTDDTNPLLAYDIQPGDELTVRIADNDEYNNNLRKEGDESKIEKSLKLHVFWKGQPIATVKSLVDGVASATEFLVLRQSAKQAFLNNTNFSATIKAEKVFLGSPEVLIEGDTMVSKPIPQTALSNILATGFVQGGKITINREIKNVDLTYTSGIKNDGKKIPVIVIKRGSYNIAYPVSLSKTASPKQQVIVNIINDGKLTDAQKIKAINAEIIRTGISSENRLSSLDDNKLQKIVKDFSENQTYISMDEFSSDKYNFENLTKDVLINIDLNNISQVFSDPKLQLDLASAKVNSEKAARYEQQNEIEDRLNEIAIFLNKDFTQNAQTKYTDSKGNIIEGTPYTDILDEGRVNKNPQSQLEKVANLKAVRDMFSKPLPTKIKEVLGKELISEINSLLEKYNLITSQIKPDRQTAQEIIDKNSCKKG